MEKHGSSSSLRGERAESRNIKKQKKFDKNRTCSEPSCVTVLSVYNRAEFCWRHLEGLPTM
jgi:hypothetical protein